MNKLGVYRVEYEITAKKEEWKAFVAGYGAEEAIAYLESIIGNINIRTVGLECKLDAITDKLRKVIVDNSMVVEKKTTSEPKGKRTIVKK